MLASTSRNGGETLALVEHFIFHRQALARGFEVGDALPQFAIFMAQGPHQHLVADNGARCLDRRFNFRAHPRGPLVGGRILLLWFLRTAGHATAQ
jgi:hypothetical protein